MANLYEILEVSENASKEVIEKAYRVLAKKYHPDLQKVEDKPLAEEKMKQINDAYDILMDEQKRKAYDSELEIQREVEKQKQEAKWQEKQARAQNNQTVQPQSAEVNQPEPTYEQSPLTKEEIKWEEKTRKQAAKEINREIQNAYAKAYNDYWRSRGYRIKEPWTWRRVLELLKVLAIMALVITCIWFFPPTHNLLVKFYEDNVIVQAIVNVIVGIIKAIGNGIATFFTNLPSF
ncbi:MAG: DnaJ domain-containing protein [Clostridia bacterium]